MHNCLDFLHSLNYRFLLFLGQQYCRRNINNDSLVKRGSMTIKDKAKKVVTKIDEAIVKTDSTVDHALDIIKSSKRTVLIIILIVGLIIWMV